MTVFQNRVRCAYVKKRSVGQMAAATVLALALLGACSFACRDDERDQRIMQGEFTRALRVRVVGWQSGNVQFSERGR